MENNDPKRARGMTTGILYYDDAGFFNPLADHPIDPCVRVQINNTIARIEEENNVKVLFACESGSRGWGFASPDSDYDVRFIYVHPPEWYLKVMPGRNVIEVPVDAIYDVNGWDIRKAAETLYKGNATITEWLSSPVIYRSNPSFTDALQAAATHLFRPVTAFLHYHYLGKKNYQDYLREDKKRLKKCLYAIRSILACLWIEKTQTMVPMQMQCVIDAVIDDDPVKAAIEQLILYKRTVKETDNEFLNLVVDEFLKFHYQRINHMLQTTSVHDLPFDTVNLEALDFTILDRLLYETILG